MISTAQAIWSMPNSPALSKRTRLIGPVHYFSALHQEDHGTPGTDADYFHTWHQFIAPPSPRLQPIKSVLWVLWVPWCLRILVWPFIIIITIIVSACFYVNYAVTTSSFLFIEWYFLVLSCVSIAQLCWAWYWHRLILSLSCCLYVVMLNYAGEAGEAATFDSGWRSLAASPTVAV